MRVDFHEQQLQSDDEQKLIRLMRGLRAVAASIVVAGIGVIAVTSIDREAVGQRGLNLPGTDGEYSTGAVATLNETALSRMG
ncbi:MAG: hypothetical protein ACREBN_02265 [Burkholderiaceae bacterium]